MLKLLFIANAAQGPALLAEETFEDVLAEELRLDEWTFWEHYENLEQKKDTTGQNYLLGRQKVAWFNDIISFW